MTIGMAWVGTRKDGRQHLYFASDSRTRGEMVFDCCPKILTLPRSDCAICFAGDTAASYPVMLQVANAVASHQPARDRSMDISQLKGHLLRILTDMIRGITDFAFPLQDDDAEFIFGGYSWREKQFRIWTFKYCSERREFLAIRARSFHSLLPQAAFVGDFSRKARARLQRMLEFKRADGIRERRLLGEYAPFEVLRDMLKESGRSDSIGGAPQLIRITEHLNTRVFAIRWPDKDTVTVMGRPLFEYENVDYWTFDPETLNVSGPRKFGQRPLE